MKAENLAYALWGNNVIIGSHIRRHLDFLAGSVPEERLGRRMDDLGCGDGKVTLLLKSVFQPARLRGYDVNHGLVKRAAKRGIEAGVIDLEERVPHGELAVLWGVLHHLRSFESCLRRVVDSYPLVFIREPVRTRWDPLELGKPLPGKELIALLQSCIPGGTIHYCTNSVLLFYIDPAYNEPEKKNDDRELPVAQQAPVRMNRLSPLRTWT